MFDHPASSAGQPVFADIETVPTQREDILFDLIEASNTMRKAALAELAPPKTLKKQETIDAWMLNEKPIKELEIEEKFQAELEAEIHKTCLDGAFGQIAVVSFAVGEADPVTLWDSGWKHPGYEAWLLNELNSELRRAGVVGRGSGQRLVGHGISFDRKMLRQRGIVLGVPVHPMFTVEVKPWENDKVVDTMALWTGDPRDRVSMDKLCRALGIDGKGTDLDNGEHIDGSKVWEFVKAGRIGDVARYCAGDVVRTRRLYRTLVGIDKRPPVPAFTPLGDAVEA